MSLETNQYPDYGIQGFTVVIYTAERRDGMWNYYFNIRAGTHEVGGGQDRGDRPYATELDAHIAATGHAKERIEYMLSQKPLVKWLEYGVFSDTD